VDTKVDGWTVKLVQPVSHRIHRRKTVVVPLTLLRYSWRSTRKMRNPVHIPNSGHYISYTYNVATGWTRWDDMNEPGKADQCPADKNDQLPVRRVWRQEILKDSYFMFYELLRGDGNVAPEDAPDSMM